MRNAALQSVIVLATVVSLPVASSPADTFTWDAGGGADANWSTGLNWTHATLPDTVPSAADDAVFGGTVMRTVNVGAGDQSISNVTVVGSARWFWLSDGGALDLAGVFSYGSSGNNSVLGARLAGNGSLLAVAGRLDVTNANTYGGTTTLAGGLLAVGNDAALGNTTATLSLGSGTLAGYLGSRVILNPVRLDGDTTFGSALEASTVRRLTFRGAATQTGNRLLSVFSDANGSRDARFDGVIDDGPASYTITKAGNGSLILTAANAFDGGIVHTSGNVLISNALALGNGPFVVRPSAVGGAVAVHVLQGSASVMVTNDLVLDGTLDTTPGAQGGRILTFSGTTTLTGNRTANIYLDGNGSRTLQLTGPVTHDPSAYYRLTKTLNGLLMLSGNVEIKGGLLIQGGTLQVAGDNSGMAGGILVNAGTVQGLARNAGLPFGPEPVILNDPAAILRLDAQNSPPVTNCPVPEVVFRNGAPLVYVNGVGGGGSWTAARLTRGGRAMLLVRGSSAAAGNPLTANDKFQATEAPAVVGGMTAPYFRETTGHFLTYDGTNNGFLRAVHTTTLNTTDPAAIVDKTTAEGLTDNRTIQALAWRTSGALDGAYRLTLTRGGLTLGGGIVACSELSFGDAEGVLYVSGNATNNAVLLATNGLTKAGAGLLVLNSDSAASLSGPVAVHAGTLRLGNANAIPDNLAVTVNSGALDLNAFSKTVSSLTMAGGAVQNSGAAPSVLTLGGDVSYQATGSGASIAPAAGKALTVALGGPRIFNLQDGWALDDMTVSATLSGGDGLMKNGPGRLYLNASNAPTLTGPVTVNGGTLRGQYKPGDNAFGDMSSPLRLNGDGVVLTSFSLTGQSTTNGVVTYSGGNVIQIEGYQNSVIWRIPDLVRAPGSRGTLLVSGSRSVGGYNDYFGSNYRLVLANRTAMGAGVMLPPYIINVFNYNAIAFSNGAESHLGSHATYDGITVKNVAYSAQGNINLAGPATLFNATTNQVLAGDCTVYALRTSTNILNGAGGPCTLTIDGGSSNLCGLIVNATCTVEPNVRAGVGGDLECLAYVAYTATATLDGQILTSGGLTKFGPGTLRLNRPAAYSGGTLVQMGTLQIADPDALGAGQLLLQRGTVLDVLASCTFGGQLSGDGGIVTHANLFTLAEGGEIAPGTGGIGALAVEDFDLRGTYQWEFDGNGNDLIEAKTLVFNGQPRVNCRWLGAGKAAPGVYVLFTYAGADPNVGGLSVQPPSGMAARVSVDSANRQVLLTLAREPDAPIFIIW